MVEECPLCEVLENFCQILEKKTGKPNLCKEVIEKVKIGKMDGEEARKLVDREFGPDLVASVLSETLKKREG